MCPLLAEKPIASVAGQMHQVCAMGIILHIVNREDWDQAVRAGQYVPASLELEGFIHCSSEDQVVNVANARYRGKAGLVLLCIDSSRVAPGLRWENTEGGTILFPHIYASLKPDAVLAIIEFEPGPGGAFSLPKEVADLCRAAG
jgi:uncharacterized protein (DUF952 family)